MDLKGIFGAVVNTVAGGIPDTIKTVVDRLVPDVQARAELSAAIVQEQNRHDEAVEAAIGKAQDEFNQRIADLEGTASDLNQAGFFGRVVLFMRGAQRPVWGFAVLAMDWSVFIAGKPLPDSAIVQQAFWIVNLLVLGFLFGERAIANILPLATQFMAARGPAQVAK